MLLVLEPEGVIIVFADLESFNSRKLLDIQFLIPSRQKIINDTLMVLITHKQC